LQKAAAYINTICLLSFDTLKVFRQLPANHFEVCISYSMKMKLATGLFTI